MENFSVKFKKTQFNFLLPKILDFVSTLDDAKEYEFIINQVRKKRSINANNYSWLLTDKLSDKLTLAGMKLSKEECHAEMIFRYGQPMLDENEVPILISVLQGVKVSDFYPYAKEIGTGKVKDKDFTHYKIYRPSHTYDSKEMAIFINGIVEECREQGIQTETPEEINKMLSLMEGK